jgi:SPP1 gp7 family putative phage head morphogenesis protein
MNVKLNGHKKKDPTAGLDDGDAVAALMKQFYAALLEDAFLDASDAGIDVSFSLANEHVQTVLGQLAKNVRSVAETTKEEIRTIIGRAAENGWSIEQIQKEIRAKGDIASRSRAILVARTESAKAYSLGSKTAWKVSGVVDRMQWLATADSCPDCQALDGKIVGVDDEFAPGVSEPPYHPACTCAITAIVKD